ncbi:MAG: tetratricopeptide repeat protein [Clostridium sp.]
MIYHCEDHTCNYWDEGEKLPERCPQCGRKLLRANEADMTGDDWTALGNTLWDAEASDKKRMVDCFRKAAYLGSAWGVCNLGICMEQGNGVEADPVQAFWLYQQAVEMGSLNAVCCLGVCYQYGIGTAPDAETGCRVIPQGGGIRFAPRTDAARPRLPRRDRRGSRRCRGHALGARGGVSALR